MHHGSSEIMVLRPTTVFLSFLASQLQEKDLPDFKLLQTDCTAYVINKHNSEEGTLNELEKYFSSMFRHEICRWLGKDARNDIETSFLDFLCCFKFELHSHIIVMEPNLSAGKQLLTIKPRTVLLNWIKSIVEGQDEVDDVMEKVTLSQLTENATVIVKNFLELKEIQSFLKHYYKPIFETVMNRMSTRKREWPLINSFESFSQYFTVEIHTQLIHLHH